MSVFVVIKGERSILEPDGKIQGIFSFRKQALDYLSNFLENENWQHQKNDVWHNDDYLYLKIEEWEVKNG